MNLPNKLTILRIILTFIFIYFISQERLVYVTVASIVFGLAAVTDFCDGYIAKKYHLVSDFGKLMDPIADKFLILAALLSFVRMHLVEIWMVLFIFGREILITGLRLFAMSKGKILSAERAGKHKTVSQMMVIFFILAFLLVKQSLHGSDRWTPEFEMWGKAGIDILMLITVGLTVVSGFSYFWKNKKLIFDE